MIDFNDFKVRCSAINTVLSNSKSNPQLTENQVKKLAEYENKLNAGGSLTEKQLSELAELRVKEGNKSRVVLSDTCIEYLMTEYAWIAERMIPIGKESLDLVAIKKGNMAEGAAASLLIRLDKQPYQLHKDRIYSDYLSGEIDLFLGETVMSAECIIDIKNSLDYPVFLKRINSGLENGHGQQVQGYMDITGAKFGFVAYTLVDCPDEVIEDMKWKLARKMNALTTESPEFIEEWKTWERSMRFEHIPIHKRAYKIPVEPFSDFDRVRLYDRVKVCREWLYNFHDQYQKINLQ